jgi:hypothetical protein
MKKRFDHCLNRSDKRMPAEVNELIDTLSDMVGRLNDVALDYMVTGSVAMSGYVLPGRRWTLM